MADVTKTNTFDKLISEHTGALPSISSTNYLEVDEPDEVENVEEAINASIEDNKQATNDAIALAEHYQRVKESKLKMLTNMIEPSAKIFKYIKAREANEKLMKEMNAKAEAERKRAEAIARTPGPTKVGSTVGSVEQGLSRKKQYDKRKRAKKASDLRIQLAPAASPMAGGGTQGQPTV